MKNQEVSWDGNRLGLFAISLLVSPRRKRRGLKRLLPRVISRCALRAGHEIECTLMQVNYSKGHGYNMET